MNIEFKTAYHETVVTKFENLMTHKLHKMQNSHVTADHFAFHFNIKTDLHLRAYKPENENRRLCIIEPFSEQYCSHLCVTE